MLWYAVPGSTLIACPAALPAGVRVIFEDSRLLERRRDQFSIKAKSTFGGIRGGQIQKVVVARPVTRQRLAESVRAKIPIGAIGEHGIIRGDEESNHTTTRTAEAPHGYLCTKPYSDV